MCKYHNFYFCSSMHDRYKVNDNNLKHIDLNASSLYYKT